MTSPIRSIGVFPELYFVTTFEAFVWRLIVAAVSDCLAGLFSGSLRVFLLGMDAMIRSIVHQSWGTCRWADKQLLSRQFWALWEHCIWICFADYCNTCILHVLLLEWCLVLPLVGLSCIGGDWPHDDNTRWRVRYAALESFLSCISWRHSRHLSEG